MGLGGSSDAPLQEYIKTLHFESRFTCPGTDYPTNQCHHGHHRIRFAIDIVGVPYITIELSLSKSYQFFVAAPARY